MQRRFKVYYENRYISRYRRNEWVIIDRHNNVVYTARTLPVAFEKIAQQLLREHYAEQYRLRGEKLQAIKAELFKALSNY